MIDQIIPIERYWCEYTGHYFLDFKGFLDDNKYVRSDLKTFKELELERCLILLGEPGMGKSTTLNQYIQSLSPEDKQKYTILDLKSEGTLLDQLKYDIQLNKWKINPQHDFSLFIDNFESGNTEIQRLKNTLIFFLKCLTPDQLKKLKLRILCRTSYWTSNLDEIIHIFQKSQEKLDPIFELLPLTIEDVKTFLQNKSISPSDRSQTFSSSRWILSMLSTSKPKYS